MVQKCLLTTTAAITKGRKKTKSQNHRLCHNNEKSWIILYQVRKFAATNGLFSFWVVLNYQLLAFQWQTVSYITSFQREKMNKKKNIKLLQNLPSFRHISIKYLSIQKLDQRSKWSLCLCVRCKFHRLIMRIIDSSSYESNFTAFMMVDLALVNFEEYNNENVSVFQRKKNTMILFG